MLLLNDDAAIMTAITTVWLIIQVLFTVNMEQIGGKDQCNAMRQQWSGHNEQTGWRQSQMLTPEGTVWPISWEANQGDLGLSGLLNEEAHPCMTIMTIAVLMVRKRPDTNQEVDGIVGSDAATLDEAECHGGHHVLHEVVTQRRGLCLQQLLFLSLYRLQTPSLTPQQWYVYLNSATVIAPATRAVC